MVVWGGARSLELGNFFAIADASYVGKENRSRNTEVAIVNMDPMDMAESMQEAMYWSNLDMRYFECCMKKNKKHITKSSFRI